MSSIQTRATARFNGILMVDNVCEVIVWQEYDWWHINQAINAISCRQNVAYGVDAARDCRCSV